MSRHHKKGCSNTCLSLSDYNGHNIIFSESQRKRKAKKHPCLNDMSPNGFVKRKIPTALIKPDFVYQDLTDAWKRNYYKIESYQETSYGRTYFYTKVVVGTKWNPWVIITAYEPQNMKEEGDIKRCLYQKQ